MSFKNYPNFVLNLSESDVKGETNSFYQFKSFRLNVEERRLFRRGEVVPLTPKAFDVLAILVERGGHLVERNELLQTVWSDSFVEEANITRTIHTLRKALGEDENGNKFIETIAKKGYRFVAEVEEISELSIPQNGNQPAEKVPENNAVNEESLAENRPPAGEKSFSEVKSKNRIILFAVGFLSAVFLLFLVSFNFRSDSSANPKQVKSIAVLPVKPITAANRDDLYEMGIADSLINRLGAMKGFYVRPLTATRQYADMTQDPIAAGREQQTDYVLASNYQIADGRIRLTAQLYNVQSGQIEETYKIEKEAGNVFMMQDAIAGEIGNLLRTRFATSFGNSSAKRGTTNEEAYRLYLQGKNLTMRRDSVYFRKSIEYFEEAIRLDPNYASAYAGLAGASIWAGISNINAMRGANEKAQEAQRIREILKKALELDPNLAEAYAVRGNLDFIYDWNLAEAEKNLFHAIELEPNSDYAHWVYSLVLAYRGRFDEALAEVEISLAIYPGALMYMRDRGRYLYYARRYDEAIAQLKRVIVLDENFGTAYGWLWRAYELKGDHAAAYETLIKYKSLKDAESVGIFQKSYETGGWQAVRRKQIELSENDSQREAYFEIARIAAVSGEKDRAFELLDKAVERREWAIIMLNVDPSLDSLHSDPRFDELLGRIIF